ncbi:MAG: carcinine hydrolase/isopenicillin-N N-acyltransferase family protein, partial [Cyanobacteria bacterium P01_D01_bin.71]
MYHPRPYGSFYDMGFKYGSLLRQKEIAPLAMTQRQAEFGEKCYQFVNGTQIQPGITFHLIIRKVLETCRTVADAIALIQAAKVASANNFLIADAAGNMAVVESAPQGAEVRYPAANENFLCITNQFQ